MLCVHHFSFAEDELDKMEVDCDDDELDPYSAAARRNRRTTTDLLRAQFADPTLPVRLRLYKYYTDDGADVIKAAEGNVASLPHTWVADLEAWKDKLKEGWVDPQPMVEEFMEEAEVELTAEQQKHLRWDVARGVELAWPKWRHLEQSLPFFRRREAWHPANEPPATREAIKEAAGPMWNSHNAAQLEKEGKAYAKKWRSGRWKNIVRPENLGKPRLGHDGKVPKGAKGVWVDPVKFWKRKDVQSEFPLLRAVAMHYLSIPLSTACMERSFSGLRNMEGDNRKALKDAGLRNEHFIRSYKDMVKTLLSRYVQRYKASAVQVAEASKAAKKGR